MAEVTRIAPVLLVANIDSAAGYYRDRLGFECEFRGDPRVMAVHRDQATILLVLTDEPERIVPHWRIVTNMWNAYFLVDDVEAMYAEVRERGATIAYEPYDSPWGFREFGVQEPRRLRHRLRPAAPMITLALLAAASPPRHDLAGTARTVRCGRIADADRRLYSVEKQDAARLTDDEMQVLNRIGDAYYAFAALETYHPADHDEFVFHVHAMGRIVMARSAARAHPERNWIKAQTPD